MLARSLYYFRILAIISTQIYTFALYYSNLHALMAELFPSSHKLIHPVSRSIRRQCQFCLQQTGIYIYIYRVSKKKSPLTKCDRIAPNIEINEIRFRHIDSDVHADLRYQNGIDRSRNAWAMSACKRRSSFAPTQGLHI